MARQVPNRSVLLGADRFAGETARLVFSLIVSSLLGLTVAGSRAGLPAAFLGTVTLASLVLHPICAKQTGYRIAMVVAVITALASVLAFLSSYSHGPIGPEGFATALWGLLQTAVIKFAYDAHRKTISA